MPRLSLASAERMVRDEGAWFVPLVSGTKKPACKLDEAVSDIAEVERMLERRDVAYVLQPCPFVVVDCDTHRVPEDEREKAATLLKVLDDTGTMVADTPRHGAHYLFRWPGEGRPSSRYDLAGLAGFKEQWVDFKASSICNAYEPRELKPLLEAPQWIVDWVAGGVLRLPQLPLERAAEQLDNAARLVAEAAEGARNQILFAQTSILASAGVDPSSIRARMLVASTLEMGEKEATIASALNACGLGAPTVSGWAHSFMQHSIYAYVPEVGAEQSHVKGEKWAKFDLAKGWLRKRGKEVEADIMNFIGSRFKDEGDGPGKSQSKVKLFTGETHSLLSTTVYSRPEDWDTDPALLGLPSGRVLCLRTGELLWASPSRKLLRRAGTDIGGQVSPFWSGLIEQWTGGDADLARYLRMLAGYVLTAGNPRHMFCYLWGPGGNGKSTWLDALCSAMGAYALNNMSSAALLTGGRGRHPTEVAQIEGKRLVVVEDMPGSGWDLAKLKQMSGGSTLNARGIGQDSRDIRIEATMICQGNVLPTIPNAGKSWSRRLHIIPWQAGVEQVDINLQRKIQADLGSVLRWMLDGHLELKANGDALPIPKCVQEATDAALSIAAVPLQQFIDEVYDVSTGGRLPMKQMAEDWDNWCMLNGHRSASADRTTPQGMAKLLVGADAPTVVGANGKETYVEIGMCSPEGGGAPRKHALNLVQRMDTQLSPSVPGGGAPRMFTS